MTVLKNALAVNDGKAVVISIKREWLAKIMSGEKTLEVRKLSLPMHQLHLKRAPQSWQYINLNADDIESVAAAIE